MPHSEGGHLSRQSPVVVCTPRDDVDHDRRGGDAVNIALVLTRRKQSIRTDPHPELARDLRDVARLFRGCPCPCYLVGGVGDSVRAGVFVRNHHDLDVGVFIDDLGLLEAHLNISGYRIVQRRALLHISPRLDLQVVADRPRRPRPTSPPPTRLRVTINASGPVLMARRRFQFFDLFLYRRLADGVGLCDRPEVIPWGDFLPASDLDPQSSLVLPNPQYRLHLPFDDRKRALDLQLTMGVS